MKRFLLTIISVLPLCAAAQNFTTLTLKEAQEKASAQQKIILVDVMNMRVMNDAKLAQEKSILALDGVSDYLEKNVIGIRIDMGTPAGKEFAPLLQMNMYPTYAYLMPNGDLLGVVSPYLLAKDNKLFLEKTKEYYSKALEKWSNTRKINFNAISFDAALERAKSEGKLVFIDAYTDNCQPCLRMEKNIFTIDRVADFYNSNFINLKLDFGADYKHLADKYKTVGYPSFLFIDGTGKLVHFESGFTEADEFIEYGKKAVAKTAIQFRAGTWSEILEMARKENKPIFMDCYTVWCGPCKQMAAQVFTNPEVAEYFNKTFINVKFDMEKGEGIELKNKYSVAAYPTFLYIDPKGNVVNRLVGSMPAAEFIAKSKEGMSEQGLASMQKKYAAGERSETFLKDYIKVLEQSYMQKEAQEVMGEFFKTADLALLKTPEYYKLFERYVNDPDSRVFKYVYENRVEFGKLFNQKALDMKLFNVWSDGSRAFAKLVDGKATFDAAGFEKYLKRMKSESVQDHEIIALNARMYNADVLGDWKEYVKLAESKIKKVKLENIPDHELYNWGMRIDKGCSDMKLRNRAAQWFKTMATVAQERELKRKEAASKGGFMMAMSMINFPKEFARLAETLSAEKK